MDCSSQLLCRFLLPAKKETNNKDYFSETANVFVFFENTLAMKSENALADFSSFYPFIAVLLVLFC